MLSDFSELVTLLSGRDLESNDCNSNREGIPYLIGASNIVDGKINITRWTTKPLVISKRGDILISCKGTIGEVVTNVIGEIHIARQFMAIQTSPMVYADYIELYIKSIVNNIKRNARGVIPGISREDILHREIALPPLEEQKRIVIEVEKWLDFIADIEAEKDELESHIKKTKSKILDLAISGKLVPQDPNNEPAIELLKRINPAFKPCDNSHYENLPQGWELVSLNSIVDIISGVSYAKSDIKENGVRILRGGNIQDGEIICLEDDVFIDQSYSNIVNSVVKGDIVLVASTGSPTLIGKTGYARITYPDTQIGAFLRIIRPKTSEISAYLNLIFNSDFYKNYIRSLAKGTNINNVKNGYIEQLEVALPPIQEQERIVKMVENIFISLDNITAGLL